MLRVSSIIDFGRQLLQLPFGMALKSIKYFIDDNFRAKVTPKPGSVLYCDLWLAVEHSGIYVDNNQISNIVVDGVAESSVLLCSAQSFTSKSKLGRKIYVSCNSAGAVGNFEVAVGAKQHVGERNFYGLIFKNCHEFSTKCVNYSLEDKSDFFSNFQYHADTWEPTLKALKFAARKKLGASKWRLWDWQNDQEVRSASEPNWEAINQLFRKQRLNKESITQIREELLATQAYEAELADENIPSAIRQRLNKFGATLSDISDKYEQMKPFLKACPNVEFSYDELMACDEDLSTIAKELLKNKQIQKLARKMGRNYISEEKKKQASIPQASMSEVHGTHRSDDLMRLLPSELLKLEDETLETLFYARLLERDLMTYELSGFELANCKQTETCKKRTGPVVACLDTSGSMQGDPLLKAKALLLAIANILKQDDRSLHVLLFGSQGELKEFSMNAQVDAAGLLAFLKHGFGGGTYFETPLQRAFDLIAEQPDYIKADVLMISDGDCQLSPDFLAKLQNKKQTLNCMVYSVLCAGGRVDDEFSDEIVLL